MIKENSKSTMADTCMSFDPEIKRRTKRLNDRAQLKEVLVMCSIEFVDQSAHLNESDSQIPSD